MMVTMPLKAAQQPMKVSPCMTMSSKLRRVPGSPAKPHSKCSPRLMQPQLPSIKLLQDEDDLTKDKVTFCKHLLSKFAEVEDTYWDDFEIDCLILVRKYRENKCQMQHQPQQPQPRAFQPVQLQQPYWDQSQQQ